jgi:hypothetical protein
LDGRYGRDGHSPKPDNAILTADELTAAPVLAFIDTLLIDDLSDEEDDAFPAAVGP